MTDRESPLRCFRGSPDQSPPAQLAFDRQHSPSSALPTVAQFQLAPSIKTTVVTTTTTTHTTLPPLVLLPPKILSQLDPKQYPLARKLTPASMKRFSFDLDGRSTCFRESDHPEKSLHELQTILHTLRNSGGELRTIEEQHSGDGLGKGRKRPASPVSVESVGSSATRAHKRQASRVDNVALGINLQFTQPEPIAPRPIRRLSSHRGPSPCSNETEPLCLFDKDSTEPPADVSTPQDAALTPTSQPVSLPSPSLSPVAAARMRGNNHANIGRPILQPHSNIPTADYASGHGDDGMLKIPEVVDTFDALPANVQTYVMYQLLRRCNKNTLQFVAQVVNPTLKCDFLALLPLEISLAVLKYLDARSLCRAAQVSKKWREIVDTDEWMWKTLFDSDGYVLENGELDHALCHGWGLLDPADDEDFGTRNLLCNNHNSNSNRPNSRAVRRLSTQRTRQTEGYAGKRGGIDRREFTALLRQVAPNPTASPRQHLFKSLYRRHHVIRRNWMHPENKPRHISFHAHGTNVVTCLQYDADKIITGSDDTCINVYGAQNGVLRKRLHGHDGGVWALQYEGNTLVSGSTDRTVRIWDIARGVCTHVFQGHTSTVRCLQIMLPTRVAAAADGKPVVQPKQPMIVTGSRDSTLKVWRLPKPTDAEYLPGTTPDEANTANNPFFVRSLVGHTHSVRAISGYGNTLISGSYDNTVGVWRISTGECVWRLTGHTQKVYSVVIDRQRNRCVSGSMDWMVKVWNLDTGTCLWTLEGHTSLVGLLDLSGEALVSAAADSTLRVWDPETGNCRHVLSAHTGAITCFQHDEQKVVSGSDGTLKMWDIRTGRFMRDLLTGLSGVWQLKMDERSLVAAVQREGVTFIEVLDFGADRAAPDLGRRIVVSEEDVSMGSIHTGSDEE